MTLNEAEKDMLLAKNTCPYCQTQMLLITGDTVSDVDYYSCMNVICRAVFKGPEELGSGDSEYVDDNIYVMIYPVPKKNPTPNKKQHLIEVGSSHGTLHINTNGLVEKALVDCDCADDEDDSCIRDIGSFNLEEWCWHYSVPDLTKIEHIDILDLGGEKESGARFYPERYFRERPLRNQIEIANRFLNQLSDLVQEIRNDLTAHSEDGKISSNPDD